MIVIKTRTGDTFVNDNEIVELVHDRDKHTAYIHGKNVTIGLLSRAKPPIEHVESVTYIHDQTGAETKDNGSEIEYLRRQLESLKLEYQCQTEITKRTKERLRSLGHECVQWAQNYHKDIPLELNEQMRNRGEEAKAYVNNDEDWLYRRDWMQNHQKPEQLEADEVARLNATVEKQAASIRELTAEVERFKAEQRFRENTYDPTTEQQQPSWWQRFLSWF